MHSPASNIDKDPYELSVPSEPNVGGGPEEAKIVWHNKWTAPKKAIYELSLPNVSANSCPY